MSEVKPPFKVEYAKSGRSTCVKCKNKIDQGNVRLGKLERSTKFDGEYYVWRHSHCFFNQFSPSSKTISGLKQLKFPDQEKIRQQCGEDGGDDEDEDEDEDEDDYDKCLGWKVEYAKSGRSACTKCAQKIENKALRLGRLEPNPYSDSGTPKWHHEGCADFGTDILDAKEVQGFSGLKPADKKTVEALVKATAGAAKTAREGADKAKADKVAKKDSEKEARKKEAELFWKKKTELEKKYTAKEIVAMLHCRGQGVPRREGPSVILERAVDCVLNGALPPCPVCESEKLTRVEEKVVCLGQLSEWSKCTFSADLSEPQVARVKWKMPTQEELDADIEETQQRKRDAKAAEQEMVAEAMGKPKEGKPKEGKKRKKTAEEAKSTEAELKKLKVADLTKRLNEKGLETKGKKAQLVARLAEAEMEVEETGEPEGERRRRRAERDEEASHGSAEVLCDAGGEPFSFVASQTDLGVGSIGKNSFYKMQILQVSKKRFVVFAKYGRIGSDVNTMEHEHTTEVRAVAEFVKKFMELCKNSWAAYKDGTFEKKPGGYNPAEADVEEPEGEEEEDAGAKAAAAAAPVETALEPRLAKFMRLIFDANTILTLMKENNIDTKKMPLGKLKKETVARGMACLEACEAQLANLKAGPDAASGSAKARMLIQDKSNQFYTLIPHDFGDDRAPPLLDCAASIQEKYDLLAALGDMEVAANILKNDKKQSDTLTHNYRQLDTDLELVNPASQEFKDIEKFSVNTTVPGKWVKGWCMGSGIKRSIIDVFRVNRHSEGERFAKNDHIGNRKLLWHGTNAAVVAAIMKGGMRIMPHSGGRVGRGIYLASENNKSAAYVQASPDAFDGGVNTGIMFLCEAALGEMKTITKDNPRLTVAPPGFDSVMAIGMSEPDPSKDSMTKIDGRDVAIAVGELVKQPRLLKPTGGLKPTNFTQSEYLVYREDQVRIRYVLKMRWGC